MTVSTTSTSGLALPGSAAPALPDQTQITSAVAQYATDLRACADFADGIIDTPFVPASFWPAPVVNRGDQPVTLKAAGRDGWDFRRRHPAESDEAFAWRRRIAVATTAATVYSGAALGLPWQAAISGIYVANGRTSLYAEQMRALILAAGHHFEYVHRGPDYCTVAVARRGGDVTQFSFAMEEAIVAGYVKGKGPNVGQNDWKGNDKYNTNPADMLSARATSIAAKSLFADVIRGMNVRELDCDDPEVEVTVVPSPPTRVTLRDLTADEPAAPEPQPSRVPVARPPADNTPTPEEEQPAPAGPAVRTTTLPINAAQEKRLGSVFTKLGVGPRDRDTRIGIVSKLVGRPVNSSKDLTAPEATEILAALEADGAEQLVAEYRREHPADAAEQDQA